MEVQSSWAADSMEPHPVKLMAAIDARMARGRNVDEFMPQVYLITWRVETQPAVASYC